MSSIEMVFHKITTKIANFPNILALSSQIVVVFSILTANCNTNPDKRRCVACVQRREVWRLSGEAPEQCLEQHSAHTAVVGRVKVAISTLTIAQYRYYFTKLVAKMVFTFCR